jgi:hypothetical protein
MKKQELLLLFVRSRLTLVQLLGDSKHLYCTMVVLLRRLAHRLLPLVFKTVEDCIPLLPVVSSKFLIEPGDGDALERSSLGLVIFFELLDDLFPHCGGVSFKNAQEVLVTLLVTPLKLRSCVLDVGNSHPLGVFHRLRSVVHPDGSFLPVSVSIVIGDVLDKLSSRTHARSYPTQGLFMEDNILKGWCSDEGL